MWLNGVTTRGRVGLLLDLGVGFSGRPSFQLEGQTNLTGIERQEFERNLAREEAEIRQAIAGEFLARFYPIVALGLRLRL